MERTPVESSMIKSVGHDPNTQTLEVEFKNGKVSTYPATADEHQALLSASSIGQHFNQHIKGRR